MRWCRCVAELLAKDLSTDFGALLDAGSPTVFTLGDYVEISKGQDFFNVRDGHTTLYDLMDADASQRYARRSGRIAVWVANHVATADDPHSMLGGTTLLDQPLWQGGKGAGVLFHAANDRSTKILSHEAFGPTTMARRQRRWCLISCRERSQYQDLITRRFWTNHYGKEAKALVSYFMPRTIAVPRSYHTTLLDQPLWQGGKGAGVLFHAANDRSTKILSHDAFGPTTMARRQRRWCLISCRERSQ